MKSQCTEQRFLKDVSKHQMTILRDDGVNRHVRFSQPDSINMSFDLITWPGYLCYCGDMGTYVFRRLTDMFAFFRTDREQMHLKDGMTLAINPGYWGEKLESISRFGEGFEVFSEEKFKRFIMEYLVSWIRDNAYRTTKDERRELWDEVINDVLGADGDGGGYRMQAAAHDFYHVTSDRVSFQFDDLFEHDFTEYTYHFIWCCYALAWAVQQYDNAKEEKAEVTA